VATGQMSHRLWDIWIPLFPRRGEGAHVVQVATGQAGHFREFTAQVRRQSGDDGAAPALAFLLCQDPGPDVPVQVDEGGVHDPVGLHAGRADVVLQIGEELCVALGNEGTGCGHGHQRIAGTMPPATG
jgi:hypothetical protein